MGTLQSFFEVEQPSPKQKRWSLVLLILFAVILYWPSLNYGFVLDDKKVITENAVTQGGADSINTIWATGSKTFQANVPDDAKNSSRAVEFGLYFAPSRLDDSTYWTDLENLAQGNEILLEQIERRKSEIFSAR